MANGSGKKKGESQIDTAAPPDAQVNVLLVQLVTKLTDLLERNSELKEEILLLKNKQMTFENNQNDLLNRIKVLEDERVNFRNTGSNDVHAIVSTVADELEERKQKDLNVVIYGLVESTDDEVEATENIEKQKVAQLFADGLKCNVSSDDITGAFRLGRRRENNEKPRPMKVYLRDQISRQTILSKRKSLANFPVGDSFRKVFIRPDWTKLQREQDFDRRQKTKDDNNGGDTHRGHFPRRRGVVRGHGHAGRPANGDRNNSEDERHTLSPPLQRVTRNTTRHDQDDDNH